MGLFFLWPFHGHIQQEEKVVARGDAPWTFLYIYSFVMFLSKRKNLRPKKKIKQKEEQDQIEEEMMWRNGKKMQWRHYILMVKLGLEEMSSVFI